MHNYKALKTAGKVSVRKQEAEDAVFNEDGSVKTKEVREELQLVKKMYNSDTGEAQDDSVRVYSLLGVKSEIDDCKSHIVVLEDEQANLEQLETDLKAL
jgi:hypothetical protein